MEAGEVRSLHDLGEAWDGIYFLGVVVDLSDGDALFHGDMARVVVSWLLTFGNVYSCGICLMSGTS